MEDKENNSLFIFRIASIFDFFIFLATALFVTDLDLVDSDLSIFVYRTRRAQLRGGLNLRAPEISWVFDIVIAFFFFYKNIILQIC